MSTGARMKIGVVIPVFVAYQSDFPKWRRLAARAFKSVQQQTRPADRVVTRVASTLREARNEGAALLGCDRVVFLDADDELDPRYLEKMEEAAGEGDIIQPATLGVYPDGREDDEPVLIPQRRPLCDGNFIVIGAMLDYQRFVAAGGFDSWPVYEDWALYLAMFCSGATIGKQPEAVYRVHVNENSRNNQDPVMQTRYYREIRQRWLGPFHAETARRAQAG